MVEEKTYFDAIESKAILLLDKQRKYIKILTDVLNQVHSVNFSSRYWNIVLGSWLMKMLAALYSKYELCAELISTDHSSNVKPILRSQRIPPFWKIVAHENYEFLSEWNEYLIESVKYLKYNIKAASIVDLFPTSNKVNKFFKEKIEAFSLCIWKFVFKIKNSKKEIGVTRDYQYFLIKSVADEFSQKLLDSGNVLLIDGWPKLFKDQTIPCNVLRAKLRSKLLNFFNELDEFDKIFLLFLVDVFPVYYLESFKQRLFLSNLAKHCKLKKCIVFHDLFHNLNINFFVAGQVELNNCKLIEMGHGGYSFTKGLLLRSWGHEILDTYTPPGKAFVVAGLKDIEFFSLKSLNITKAYTFFDAGRSHLRALYVTTIYSPNVNFLVRIAPELVYPEKYLSEMSVFINYFLKNEHHYLEWRPFLSRLDRKDNHIDVVTSLLASDVKSRMKIHLKNSFYSRLEASDLYVTDHFSTTILEAFCFGIPVVAFWADVYDSYCPDPRGQLIMKNLRAVKILHPSAAMAADFLKDKNKNDVIEWWESAEVIAVRESFNDMFFRKAPNSVDTFVRFIKDLSS